MDKIIDGVDVSGCKHYKIETCVADYLLTDINFSEAKCKLCPNCYYKQLKRAKAELKKYEDMAKKGLEEFKDVGGCWGCGLQLQLNQDMEDIKKLKAENERLKEGNNDLCKALKDKEFDRLIQSERKLKNLKQANIYRQALQEIKDIVREETETRMLFADEKSFGDFCKIQAKINEVIGVE